MPNIPPWAYYIGLGIVVVGAIWLLSEYLDAATGLLPGGGEG